MGALVLDIVPLGGNRISMVQTNRPLSVKDQLLSREYRYSSLRRIAELFTANHCRPVKQAVSADKGMILNAVLAI
jgi:hypothetical protein